MKSKYSICSVLLVLLLASGCARPPVPAERPPSVPFDSGKLEARSDAWRDYEARFRLRVEGKTSNFSARTIVFVKEGGFVRFETFGPLGQTAALYVAGESGPSLLIPSEKMLFTAQLPETLIRHFLGISLPFDVLRYSLTASVPPEQLPGLKAHSDAGIMHVISQTANRYFDWQFSPDGSSLNGVFARAEGFEGRISYDPAVALAADAAPKKIRISSSEWSVEIGLEEIKPVSEFPPRAFYMPELPDVRKVDLDKIK